MTFELCNLNLILLLLTILSISLGQLGRLPFLPEGLNLYITDILVAATVFYWFLHSFIVKKKLKLPRRGFLILAFIFIAFISLINSSQYLESLQELLISASYLARFVFYSGLFFVGASLDKQSREKIISVFLLSGVLLALFGFIQLLFFPDWSQFAYLGWDPHKNRLLSTFFDPNFTGIYLVLVINLFFYRFVETGLIASLREKITFPSILLVAVAVICSIGLLLTFSRSAWLAMAISIFIWGIFKSKKLFFAAALLAFLAYFAIPRVQTRIAGGFDPDDSAKLRFQSWSNTWQIAKQKPIIGVGFNTFRYAQEREGYFDWRQPEGGHSGAGSDSSLLFVFATTGALGLVAYLGILATQSFNHLTIFFFHRKKFALRGIFIISAVAALLTNSVFINSLFYPAIMIFYWLLVF